MNRFKTVSALALAAVMLAACGRTAATQQNGNAAKAEDNKVVLNAEQLDYITANENLTEDAVSLMDYESVNWYLLGTGLELYNQTSGVEKNGITYKNDSGIDYAKAEPESKNRITLDEVYVIRDKEADIRLEDFMKYMFEIKAVNADDGRYAMYVPLKDYENTYVVTVFKVQEDGTVKLKVPFLSYTGSGGADNTFSIDYDRALFDAFFENGDYSVDGKLFYGIQYSSVTGSSLVLQVFNNTNEEVTVGKEFRIYKVNGTDKELVSGQAQGPETTVDKETWSLVPVSFNTDETLSSGKYILGFGDAGTELEFTIE